jgi:hypothetical protein
MRRIDFRATGWIGALISVAATACVAGCGSTPAAATASPMPAASPAAPSPTPNLAAAGAAALTIFYALPGQNPEVWVPCSSQGADFVRCPFAATVKTRLSDLSSSGYFGDAPPGKCGEDYITGTQNGLFSEPKMLSSAANADGSVTVVIRRGPPPPDFTVTMKYDGGAWLATDLASGTGPAASVFSATPNC